MSFVNFFLICTKNAHFTHIVLLFNVDGSTSFALYFLYHFSTWPDHCTNIFAVNEHFHHTRGMWLHIRAGFWYTIVHGIKNMHPSTACLFKGITHDLHA